MIASTICDERKPLDMSLVLGEISIAAQNVFWDTRAQFPPIVYQ
jgi:hypothetical protein